MIKCAIVDHQPQTIELLKKHIAKTGVMQIVHTSSAPIALFNFLDDATVDIIYLNIQIPELTGMQFMKIATGKYPVIITSTYMDQAIKGYEVNVIDYLLKPITFERFYKSIERIEACKNKNQRKKRILPPSNLDECIFIKTAGVLRKINHHEIFYIEDNSDTVLIHTIDETYKSIECFSALAESLPKSLFLQIDTTYIVALYKIDFVERTRLSINNTFLPIGADYKTALFNIISNIQ